MLQFNRILKNEQIVWNKSHKSYNYSKLIKKYSMSATQVEIQYATKTMSSIEHCL